MGAYSVWIERQEPAGKTREIVDAEDEPSAETAALEDRPDAWEATELTQLCDLCWRGDIVCAEAVELVFISTSSDDHQRQAQVCGEHLRRFERLPSTGRTPQGEQIETGERIMESPTTDHRYRVTEWVDHGDGKFTALEKDRIKEDD
jgi:hypothetical protein